MISIQVAKPQISEFYNKPYAQCFNCIQSNTKCKQCFSRIFKSIKNWTGEKRVRLIQPIINNKRSQSQIIERVHDYRIHNVSMRKTQQDEKYLVYKQPVLHKNTLLNDVKPFLLISSKNKGERQNVKKQRKLLLNFSYKQEHISKTKNKKNLEITNNIKVNQMKSLLSIQRKIKNCIQIPLSLKRKQNSLSLTQF